MYLQLQDIRISYSGENILQDFCLNVEKGEFVSILGPSGCGKSTLLNIVSGALRPQHGTVLLNGHVVNGISSSFAVMPQDDLLFSWRTILDNVCLYGLVNGGLPELRRTAMQNMSAFGLTGYENKYPSALSGGMRQRAAFLRTALCPADVMLLDEPFASLDVITREDMQLWLMNMRQELNKTTLLVTHDVDEALLLSDRVIVLNGQPATIVQQLTPPPGPRSRKWLLEQAELKAGIYDNLKT